MGVKDDFLSRLAEITDKFDSLNLKQKKIVISIYLENDEYYKISKIFNFKGDEDVNSFSIYIDDYEIVVLRHSNQ